MNRELLERPFPPEQIRTRVGRHGKPLDYVDGRSVVQRLNEALGHNWSFQVERYEVRDDIGEVIVLGRLASGDVVKMQFGGSTITRSREGGEPVSLADDLKAASTDSLKKAASLLGVGLHLYSDDGLAPAHQQGAAAELPAKTAATRLLDPPRPSASRRARPDGNQDTSGARLTAKQFNYLLALSQEAGISRTRMEEYSRTTWGTVLSHLSRSQATKMIDELLRGDFQAVPTEDAGRSPHHGAAHGVARTDPHATAA